MRKDCESCSNKEQCWNGKNVGVAYLDASIAEKASRPNSRETMTINVGGVLTTAYKDDIEREIYKEKGQGMLKKETVIEFLNKNGIKMSIEQMDFLIDAIVTEFNKNGWDNVIVKVGE